MNVKTVLEDVERPGAKPPRWDRLQILYDRVREARFEHCIEYGCGWSTLAIALALAENEFGTLASYETMPKWAELTRVNLNDLNLRRAQVVDCEAAPLSLNGYTGWQHLCVTLPADFVHVDGPALNAECRVTHIMGKLHASAVIVVDGRDVTCRYYDTLYNNLGRRKGLTFYGKDESAVARSCA